jgi:hypothetical protein
VKKKIAPFIIFLLIFSTLPNGVNASGHNPYSRIYAVDNNLTSTKFELISAHNSLGGTSMKAGAYLCFKGVDFGDSTPYKADIYAAAPLDTPTYMGGSIELRIGSNTGPVIGTTRTRQTGVHKLSCEITGVSGGVHDLYVVFPDKQCAFNSLVFHRYSDEQSGPVIYETADYLNDIRDNPMRADIYSLIELGLIEPFLADEYNEMTGMLRGEFAKSMAEILNISENYNSSDSNSEGKYDKEIAFLREQGIITGGDDGVFAQNEYITVNDAVVMAVRMLGYNTIALNSGGYPHGYFTTALSLGLLKGVSNDGILRRGDALKLIYNIINAEYIETTSIRGDSEGYTKIKGILSKTKNLYKGTGTVTANEDTSTISPSAAATRNTVCIDNVAFNVGKTTAPGLLGYNVIYYYSEQDDNKTLVSIIPDKRMELVIIDTRFGDHVTALTEEKIEYVKSGEDRRQAIKLVAGTRFIYNGKAIDDMLVNLLDEGEFRGIVRYLENFDGTACVLIEQYRNVWVKSINASAEVIYDAITGEQMHLSGKDAHILILYNGKNIYFSGIDTNDILSVFESKNKAGEKLIRADVSTRKVNGTISEVSDGDVYIGNGIYKKAPELNLDVSPGLSAQFYISTGNEIVGYDILQSIPATDKVGLLIAYDSGASTRGLTTEIKIKIFEDTNKSEIYKLADKVLVDGYVMKSHNEVLNGKGEFAGLLNMKIINSLVRYRIDENGEVSMLDTYLKGAGTAEDCLYKINKNTVTMNYNGTSMLFTDTSGYAYAPYRTMPKLFGFFIAQDADTAFYETALSSMASSSRVIPITGDIYTLNEDEPYVSYVFWDGASSSSYDYPFVFEKMSLAIHNGEECYRILGQRDTENVEYFIKKSDFDEAKSETLKQLKSIFTHARTGDVIRVTRQGNFIGSAELAFLRDGAEQNPDGITVKTNLSNGLGNVGGVSRPYYTLYGTVVSKMGIFLKVSYVRDSQEGYEYFRVGNACMSLSYAGDKAIVQNNLPIDSIMIGDKIFTATQEYYTRVLCILEK